MDGAITLGLYNLAVGNAWLATLAVAIADAGVFVLPVALLVVWLRASPTPAMARRAVVAGCMAALVAMCLGLVLERTLGRPRPFVEFGIAPLIPHAPDSSFPSDHTLVGVALVGALSFRVPRVGVWLLAWALVVGMARVAAALHHPSDILGSALLALSLAGLAWMLTGGLPNAASSTPSVKSLQIHQVRVFENRAHLGRRKARMDSG